MKTYSFLDIGSDNLYQHLYKCIKEDIISGELQPDEKLPSKRSFAKHLGVSTITVENAYGQLSAEGWIYSLPRKGFFVSKIAPENIVVPITQEQYPESPAVAKEYFADFSSNENIPENFPFSIWTKLIREVITSDSKRLMTNSPGNGMIELRQAICDYLSQFQGMNVHPSQVVVGAGTEYLYGILIKLLGRDKVYAVENPGYKKIAKIYESHQVNWCYLDIDEQGLSIDKLKESASDVIHISPSHHFPTGITTPISRRYELLGWAAGSPDRYIIEDDYDSEFRLVGKPIPSLQSIDVSDKVIYLNTFTKSLASTIRISYLILPRPLVEAYHRKLDFYSCTVSNFEQLTLARFIDEGYFEKHINRMRSHYKKQRDKWIEAIDNSSLSSKSQIREANSGLHFLLKIETKMTRCQLEKKAEKAGLKLSLLNTYYYDEKNINRYGPTLIINYSSIPGARIAAAVAKLAALFE